MKRNIKLSIQAANNIFIVTLLSVSMAGHASPTSFAKARATVEKACRAYCHYDRDHDDRYEIENIARPMEKGRYAYEAAGTSRGTVLVFVEQRLWEKPTGSVPEGSLRPSLKTYVHDLAR